MLSDLLLGSLDPRFGPHAYHSFRTTLTFRFSGKRNDCLFLQSFEVFVAFDEHVSSNLLVIQTLRLAVV